MGKVHHDDFALGSFVFSCVALAAASAGAVGQWWQGPVELGILWFLGVKEIMGLCIICGAMCAVFALIVRQWRWALIGFLALSAASILIFKFFPPHFSS